MSATYRFEFGEGVRFAIDPANDFLPVKFKMKALPRPVTYLVSYSRDYHALTMELPKNIASAMRLYRKLVSLMDEAYSLNVRYGYATAQGIRSLFRKLTLALGLPWQVAEHREPEDAAFLAAVTQKGSDVATWSAYADWLLEHDGKDYDRYSDRKRKIARSHVQPDHNTRGRVMAGWLADETRMKTRDGMPLLLFQEV